VKGFEALSRAVVGVVSTAKVGWLAPRLALEVIASPRGTRLGVWVPRHVRVDAVGGAIQRGLPGCQVRLARVPMAWSSTYPVRGWELRPRQGPRTVLVEPARARAVLKPVTDSRAEPLRGVFDALHAAQALRVCSW
jgi:hypothetical protein